MCYNPLSLCALLSISFATHSCQFDLYRAVSVGPSRAGLSMEATIVCIDNSEWTRSGDYAPNRFQAQADAVNLLAGAKTQAHPENTVGVLTMAGKTPRVLVTPTPDLGKVLNCMTDIDLEPECNFAAAVQVAQLALKHRQNKNQRQRIVIFAGSPIAEEQATLVKIAKKLKKNSVAVDIVSFGCESENEEKLNAFHQAVNSNGNSHLVTVPAGPVLSDVLISSPIFQGEGGSGFGGAGTSGAEGFEFGVDPNIDPDLALALRVSLEEERARQNTAAEAAATAAGGDAAASGGAVGTEKAAVGVTAPTTDMDLDEDALLQQALAMSMQVEQGSSGTADAAASTPAPAPAPAATPVAPNAPGPAAAGGGADAMLEDVEDEELRLALALSMQDAGPEQEKKADS